MTSEQRELYLHENPVLTNKRYVGAYSITIPATYKLTFSIESTFALRVRAVKLQKKLEELDSIPRVCYVQYVPSCP
jgi:hypothetical protein